ncbi:MAG TPA: CDP-alcohol phosphatidyltransferase family protein [Candidatus Binatia bacterium]|nr:CDP-alcohol phosphatidyltransferase family protein [Candidatus Binatia bacterium]
MIAEAIVTAGSGDVDRLVAGVPLLLRTVLTLQRAGLERCVVIGAPSPVDPRLRIVVESRPVLAATADDELRLVVGPGTVIDAVLVRRLVADARPVLLARDGARVAVVPGSALGREPSSPASWPPVGTLEPVDAPAGRIAQSLLLGLENHRDGYLDHLINRRLSRPMTRGLLPTCVTPNMVTVVGIALGMAGGLALSVPSSLVTVLAVACLVLSGALDCVDGELARIRFSESKLGHVLDVTGDTVVHATLLLGIGVRLERTGELPDWSVLITLGIGILGAFAVITAAEVTETRRHRASGWENAVIDGVLSPLTTRDWYVFPVAFALLGRLDLLVPSAAVGAHVFWIVTLVILLRALARAR